MSVRDDLQEKIVDLGYKVKELVYEKRSLRIALKKAMKNWSDSSDSWDSSKDKEWKKMEKLLNQR